MDRVPTAVQLGMAVALLLALVVVVSAATMRTWLTRFGPTAVCWTTGWFGVPVHEGSHWLACKLLGRQVIRVRWFEPDLAAGTLGRVEFVQGNGPLGWLAGAAVGLAPLLGGTLVLHGLAWLCGVDGLHTLATRVGHARSPAEFAALVAWLWTSACVAVHLVPSKADLLLAWRGVVLAALLVAAAVWGLQRAGVDVREPVLQGLGRAAGWALPALALALVSVTALGLLGWLLRLVLPAPR